MEYQNTDEAIRRDACERVKQIVKAIKAIKIKYYLNFTKISAKDQETYQKLKANLDKISEEHNLNNLKVALMQEVSAKYDGKEPADMKHGEQPEPDNLLQACYGAIDAQKEALSRGRITQAIKCQEKLQQYMQGIDLETYRGLVINYKREKFAELMQTRDEVEGKNAEWYKMIRTFYEDGHAMERQDAVNLITRTPEKTMVKNKLEDEISFA